MKVKLLQSVHARMKQTHFRWLYAIRKHKITEEKTRRKKYENKQLFLQVRN